MYEYYVFIVHPFRHIYKIRIHSIFLLTRGDKGQSLLSETIDGILRKNISARNLNEMIVGDKTEPSKVGKIVLSDVPSHDIGRLGSLLPKDWDHDFYMKNMTVLEDNNETL